MSASDLPTKPGATWPPLKPGVSVLNSRCVRCKLYCSSILQPPLVSARLDARPVELLASATVRSAALSNLQHSDHGAPCHPPRSFRPRSPCFPSRRLRYCTPICRPRRPSLRQTCQRCSIRLPRMCGIGKKKTERRWSLSYLSSRSIDASVDGHVVSSAWVLQVSDVVSG